jgi:hypothetical protein
MRGTLEPQKPLKIIKKEEWNLQMLIFTGNVPDSRVSRQFSKTLTLI